MTTGDLGEFGVIQRVVAKLAEAPPSPHTLLGPGDDAAVVRAADGRVVATTDVLVEGRHFRFDWSSPRDVGHKAAAQSLADIAAMGAVPTALLVGLGAPATWPVRAAEELAEGLRDEAAKCGAVVVGGDLVRAEHVTIAVTALGDLQGRAPVRRAGAQIGDQVVLAGQVGGSGAGMRLLQAGLRDGPEVTLHRRPRPPYAMGPALADAGATAMVDVSDGLAADLGHVAAASRVTIALESALLQLDGEVTLTDALGGGEDHALVATMPPGLEPPDGARRIGLVITALDGVPVLVDGAPAVGGFDHFGGARE